MSTNPPTTSAILQAVRDYGEACDDHAGARTAERRRQTRQIMRREFLRVAELVQALQNAVNPS